MQPARWDDWLRLSEDLHRHLAETVRVVAELAGAVGPPAVQRARTRAGAAVAEARVDGREAETTCHGAGHQPVQGGSIADLTHLVLSPAQQNPAPLPMSAQV